MRSVKHSCYVPHMQRKTSFLTVRMDAELKKIIWGKFGHLRRGMSGFVEDACGEKLSRDQKAKSARRP